MPAPFLHVVAAAVFNQSGEVLLALRHEHAHQGGRWEFPGGKLEPGEPVAEGLVRELREELGIVPLAFRPLIRVPHRYPDRSVLLDVWRVDRFAGDPHGREGQVIAWVDPEAMAERRFPDANLPIVTAVRLPSLYLVTGEPAQPAGEFLRRLEEALTAGIRLVQLRAKGLGRAELESLAVQAAALAHDRGARLLVNGDPALAERVGADGVHLDSRRLMSCRDRPLGRDRWVAASCHDARELEQAHRIGADFAVISPVRATGTHPDARPLGWDGFARLAELARVPVYGLGGLVARDRERIQRLGGQGIAAITALWGRQRAAGGSV